MIRLEEAELERQVIETGYEIAVPFEMNSIVGGGLELLVYSFCEKTAEEFEKCFCNDPTSEEAKEFLYERISPIMRSLDYRCDDALDVIYYEFHAEPGDTVSAELIDECDIVDDLSGERYCDLPLDEFEFLETDPCDRMAIFRRDGMVVCYAGLNDVCENDGYYEITVECEEDYRGHGYASACVAALTRHILSHGERVKYICTSDNVASIRTAEAVGFKSYKVCMPFVCFKEQDDNENENEEE